MGDKKVCLVTGAAGFVGSHLARRLLNEGCRVYGVDCFTDYYDRDLKEQNITDLLKRPGFELIRRDVAGIEDGWFTEKMEWVFHQSAQAGVRASWGEDFSHYTHQNILATQRLLEWVRGHEPACFVYASSSSIYGNTGKLPMHEDDLPRPLSPYGVTKLAGEHLCTLYYENFSVPVVCLRYFTVFGPGQRPDMAFHRFIRALLEGREAVIYGTGEQTRDFTYIDDIVEANLAAAKAPGTAGRIYNIGGGRRISVNGVIDILNSLADRRLQVRYEPVQAGDPLHTYADTTRAREELHFQPAVSLEEGLQRMLNNYGAC